MLRLLYLIQAYRLAGDQAAVISSCDLSEDDEEIKNLSNLESESVNTGA